MNIGLSLGLWIVHGIKQIIQIYIGCLFSFGGELKKTDPPHYNPAALLSNFIVGKYPIIDQYSKHCNKSY